MSEMVERVARALYAQKALLLAEDDPRCDLSDVNLNTWFDTNAQMPLSGSSFVEEWSLLARAAIKAMREPTEEMLKAAIDAVPMDKIEDGIGYRRRCTASTADFAVAFPAMIDTALSEGEANGKS